VIIESGRSTARNAAAAHSRRAAVARLRGGSAGSISGALSIAAHGWASGGVPVQSSTVALLVASSTVVGALVAGVGPLRSTATGLVAALIGGQLLGHTTMSIGMMHTHHAKSMWSPAMLAAHIVAAVVAAFVIHGAEAAYRVATAALSQVLPALLRTPVIPGPPLLRIGHRDHVIQRILAADTFRTRGPPVLVRG
jgi:hypothetical protein